MIVRNHLKVSATLGMLVPALWWITGCAHAEPKTKTYSVTIRGFKYDPDPVPVAVGDTVVWANADLVPHTATAQDTRWDSGGIAPGASWRYVAEEKGSHAYICTFHPGMKATLVVR